MRVRMLERIEQIPPELEHLFARHGTGRQPVGQGFTVEVLHGVVWKPIGLVRFVDLDDVRVGETGERLGLPGKPQGGRGRVQLGPDHLHRHEALEAGLVGENDDAHASAPQHAVDLVALLRKSGTHPLEERGHGPSGENFRADSRKVKRRQQGTQGLIGLPGSSSDSRNVCAWRPASNRRPGGRPRGKHLWRLRPVLGVASARIARRARGRCRSPP